MIVSLESNPESGMVTEQSLPVANDTMPQLSRGPYVLCPLIYEMLKISCGISSENSSSVCLPCFQDNAESCFSQNVWLCFLNVPETFSFCHGRTYFLDRDLPMWHLYKTVMWKRIISHWPTAAHSMGTLQVIRNLAIVYLYPFAIA